MAQNKILNVHNRQEFRDWLTKNSLIEKECFLVLKRGKPTDPKVFYYLDAVEEALCFGWIDSVLKNIDGKMVQRFSPRTKNSPWSALNRERVKRLIKLGFWLDTHNQAIERLYLNLIIQRWFLILTWALSEQWVQGRHSLLAR